MATEEELRAMRASGEHLWNEVRPRVEEALHRINAAMFAGNAFLYYEDYTYFMVINPALSARVSYVYRKDEVGIEILGIVVSVWMNGDLLMFDNASMSTFEIKLFRLLRNFLT